MNTKQVVINMLTENTGIHFLDSGFENGRHWQKNQAVKDWDSTPEYTLEVWSGDDFYHIKSIYHHLINTAEFCEEVNAAFYKYANQVDPDNTKYWRTLIEDFTAEFLEGGRYAVDNTYNHENGLSQDMIIHFTSGIYESVEFEGVEYRDLIAIQIHNGADARGGYTAPVWFTVEDYFYMYNDADIFCNTCWASWYTDDGHNWYKNNNPDMKRLIKNPQDTALINVEDYTVQVEIGDLKDYDLEINERVNQEGKVTGRDLLCPICGGVLSV